MSFIIVMLYEESLKLKFEGEVVIGKRVSFMAVYG